MTELERRKWALDYVRQLTAPLLKGAIENGTNFNMETNDLLGQARKIEAYLAEAEETQ